MDMKVKEFLKDFNRKHGTESNSVWETHDLVKLMTEYEYHCREILNGNTEKREKKLFCSFHIDAIEYCNEFGGCASCSFQPLK